MWPGGCKNREEEREEKKNSSDEEDRSLAKIALPEAAVGLPHGDVRGRVPVWRRRTEISSSSDRLIVEQPLKALTKST